jgi:Uma2 family endonuclease
MSDMRLKVANDRYYYPDVVVVCTPMGDLDLVAEDPCVVVEVTSPSTARVDRTEKLDAYRGIPTLQAYLVVDHRRRRVQRHWREMPEGIWQYDEIVGEDETPIPVPCLHVPLTLDAIFRRVLLPALGEPDAEYDPADQDGSAQE